jgi:hypothetical protein
MASLEAPHGTAPNVDEAAQTEQLDPEGDQKSFDSQGALTRETITSSRPKRVAAVNQTGTKTR